MDGPSNLCEPDNKKNKQSYKTSYEIKKAVKGRLNGVMLGTAVQILVIWTDCCPYLSMEI